MPDSLRLTPTLGDSLGLLLVRSSDIGAAIGRKKGGVRSGAAGGDVPVPLVGIHNLKIFGKIDL